MAKKSKIARQQQREAAVARYAERRRGWKRVSVDPAASAQERQDAMAALHAMPRNASLTRLRRRDSGDGRPRGHLRKFGLSRVSFRQAALRGELPGVTKASW